MTTVSRVCMQENVSPAHVEKPIVVEVNRVLRVRKGICMGYPPHCMAAMRLPPSGWSRLPV